MNHVQKDQVTLKRALALKSNYSHRDACNRVFSSKSKQKYVSPLTTVQKTEFISDMQNMIDYSKEYESQEPNRGEFHYLDSTPDSVKIAVVKGNGLNSSQGSIESMTQKSKKSNQIDKKPLKITKKVKIAQGHSYISEMSLELEPGHLIVGENVTEKLKKKDYENSMQKYQNNPFDVAKSDLEASFDAIANLNKKLSKEQFKNAPKRGSTADHNRNSNLNNSTTFDLSFPAIGSVDHFENSAIETKSSDKIIDSKNRKNSKPKSKFMPTSFVFDNEPWKIDELESDLLSESIVLVNN